jgi:hypothetical protein
MRDALNDAIEEGDLHAARSIALSMRPVLLDIRGRHSRIGLELAPFPALQGGSSQIGPASNDTPIKFASNELLAVMSRFQDAYPEF